MPSGYPVLAEYQPIGNYMHVGSQCGELPECLKKSVCGDKKKGKRKIQEGKEHRECQKAEDDVDPELHVVQ